MNRRTFIKVTGLTTLLTTIPAFSAPEQQWIKLSEQLPKIGQKVVFLYRHSPVIIDRYPILKDEVRLFLSVVSNVNKNKVQLVVNNYYAHYYNYNPVKRGYAEDETCVSNAQKYDAPLKNIPWKRVKYKSSDFSLWRITIDNPNIYWMPMTKLPDELPKMPSISMVFPETRWRKFSEETPIRSNLLWVKLNHGYFEGFRYITNLGKEKFHIDYHHLQMRNGTIKKIVRNDSISIDRLKPHMWTYNYEGKPKIFRI